MSSYPGKLTGLAVSVFVLVVGAVWMLFQGHLLAALLLVLAAAITGLYFAFTKRFAEHELKNTQSIVVRTGDH